MVECFVCVYFPWPQFNGHTYMGLTCSTSSVLIPTNTSASVTIDSVSAGTSMLTRLAGTFVGIWSDSINTETSTHDSWVYVWESLGWVAEYIDKDIFSCYINGPQPWSFWYIVKICFYTAQYPILRNGQSTLYFLPFHTNSIKHHISFSRKPPLCCN